MGDTVLVTTTEDGVRLRDRAYVRRYFAHHRQTKSVEVPDDPPDLVQALTIRSLAHGMTSRSMGRMLSPTERGAFVDYVAAKVLVLRRSERWREAVSTALLSDWCEPLWNTGRLPATALVSLKAEARTLHRQLVPVHQRGTRHGRVLSLDAALGDGLSLHDLVTADVDLLTHTAGGVYADERLNAVLRGLEPAERRVVVAYGAAEGTTWAEAAAAAGAVDPEAFGERVRRKTKRLATEQRRRIAQRISDLRTQELRA
jgi:hypothetical protein